MRIPRPHTYEKHMLALITVERFAEIQAQIDALPAPVDREAVYRALMRGVILHEVVEQLDPEWTRDRDDAYRSAEDANRRLRGVLERRELGHRTADLEIELFRLATDSENDALRMGSNRADLCPPPLGGNGRPRDLWRDETMRRLRGANMTIENAEAVLSAAGLRGTTPKRAQVEAPPQVTATT